MKKLLSIIGAIGLVAPASLSVVSCGPKIDHDVLLILPGERIGQSSTTTKAYQTLVQDFDNSDEMRNSDTKVKVIWEPDDAIGNRFVSLQQLPDLYVNYSDRTGEFAYIPETANEVRDMAATMYGYDDNNNANVKKLTDQYWDTTSWQEGYIPGAENKPRILNMQVNKSFEVCVVNLRLFDELAQKLGINSNLSSTGPSKLFKNAPSNLDLSKFDSLKEKLAKVSNVDDAREFFKYDDNVLQMTQLYSTLYKASLNNSYDEWKNQGISDPHHMFATSFDDIPNKIYTEYGDKQKGELNPMDGKDNFIYSVSDINGDNESMNVQINKDTITNSGYSNTMNFFNGLKQAAYNPDPSNKSDTMLPWNAATFVGTSDPAGSIHSSNFFNQGTALVTSISSSRIDAFKPDAGINKGMDNWFNNKADSNGKSDVLTVGNSSGTGNYFNFVSQGPGLAGFKSVGSNAAQKEKVTSEFVRFLMQPKNLTKLSLIAGYIPSTKDALEYYKNYRNGDFNNATGKWTTPLPSNASDYQQITVPGSNQDTYNYLATDMISNYLDPKAYFKNNKQNEDEVNVVSTTANPAGQYIRDDIRAITINYIFKGKSDFAQLLDEGNSLSNLSNYLRKHWPGSWDAAKVTVKDIN